jgi:hypothetical protein
MTCNFECFLITGYIFSTRFHFVSAPAHYGRMEIPRVPRASPSVKYRVSSPNVALREELQIDSPRSTLHRIRAMHMPLSSSFDTVYYTVPFVCPTYLIFTPSIFQ